MLIKPVIYLLNQFYIGNEFHVTSFPYSFSFTTGIEIILSCHLPNAAVFSHWTNPSGNSISVSAERYVVDTIGLIKRLKVKNSTQLDGGTYTCYISKYMKLFITVIF